MDLYRAQTQVDAARGDVARFTQLVAQDENALNLLLARSGAERTAADRLAATSPLPEEISAGVSSEVLLRRPDVLQAESLLQGGQCRHRRRPGGVLPAHFPDRRRRHRQQRALRTLRIRLGHLELRAAGGNADLRRPHLVGPEGDQSAAGNRRDRSTRRRFRLPSGKWPMPWPSAARWTSRSRRSNRWSTPWRKPTACPNARYDKGIDSYLSVLDAQRSLYAAQQGLVSLHLAKLANQVTTLRRPGRRRRLALGRTRPESRLCPRKQGRQNVVG